MSKFDGKDLHDMSIFSSGAGHPKLDAPRKAHQALDEEVAAMEAQDADEAAAAASVADVRSERTARIKSFFPEIFGVALVTALAAVAIHENGKVPEKYMPAAPWTCADFPTGQIVKFPELLEKDGCAFPEDLIASGYQQSSQELIGSYMFSCPGVILKVESTGAEPKAHVASCK